MADENVVQEPQDAPHNGANINEVDPSVDQDKASDTSVDANPTPGPGETPEGSTVSPQPTEGGNVQTVGGADDQLGGVADAPAPVNQGTSDSSGVQTSSDLR